MSAFADALERARSPAFDDVKRMFAPSLELAFGMFPNEEEAFVVLRSLLAPRLAVPVDATFGHCILVLYCVCAESMPEVIRDVMRAASPLMGQAPRIAPAMIPRGPSLLLGGIAGAILEANAPLSGSPVSAAKRPRADPVPAPAINLVDDAVMMERSGEAPLTRADVMAMFQAFSADRAYASAAPPRNVGNPTATGGVMPEVVRCPVLDAAGAVRRDAGVFDTPKAPAHMPDEIWHTLASDATYVGCSHPLMPVLRSIVALRQSVGLSIRNAGDEVIASFRSGFDGLLRDLLILNAHRPRDTVGSLSAVAVLALESAMKSATAGIEEAKRRDMFAGIWQRSSESQQQERTSRWAGRSRSRSQSRGRRPAYGDGWNSTHN